MVINEVSTTQEPRLARRPEDAIEQLSSIFAAYNETAERIRRSHIQLQAEVKRLRRELKQKNEQLERKSRLAALGEMAAGMAHEIRNPLGGVQLYISLLQRDLTGQPGALQWVGKIGKCVHELDMIVNDILAFTQDQVCEKQPVKLAELAAEVVDYLQPQIKTTNVQISLEEIASDLVVDLDINMMKRVFLNLILNAIEATDKSGWIKVTAEKYSKDSSYQARICVIDNGSGIKPEILSKIFNPFFTCKDNGTGLGLAIVHRLIECHGGVISAGNNREGGAIFTILLP